MSSPCLSCTPTPISYGEAIEHSPEEAKSMVHQFKLNVAFKYKAAGEWRLLYELVLNADSYRTVSLIPSSPFLMCSACAAAECFDCWLPSFRQVSPRSEIYANTDHCALVPSLPWDLWAFDACHRCRIDGLSICSLSTKSGEAWRYNEDGTYVRVAYKTPGLDHEVHPMTPQQASISTSISANSLKAGHDEGHKHTEIAVSFDDDSISASRSPVTPSTFTETAEKRSTPAFSRFRSESQSSTITSLSSPGRYHLPGFIESSNPNTRASSLVQPECDDATSALILDKAVYETRIDNLDPFTLAVLNGAIQQRRAWQLVHIAISSKSAETTHENSHSQKGQNDLTKPKSKKSRKTAESAGLSGSQTPGPNTDQKPPLPAWCIFAGLTDVEDVLQSLKNDFSIDEAKKRLGNDVNRAIRWGLLWRRRWMELESELPLSRDMISFGW